MRLLPDKPSIEFLRKEAKDLLGVLRESQPETSLAEAQRALAAEYGMRDWPALKAEVDRRIAEPPAPPTGLTEAIADAFGLGQVTAPARPVAFTPMGRCWAITTERGRWLAVTVYPWITEDQARTGTRLRDAAAAAGVAAPVRVCSPQGRLIETVHEESWRVHEWIEVGPAPVTPVSAVVARRIGTTFGTLHALAIASDEPISPYLTWRRPDAEWHHLRERAAAAGKPWAERLDAFLPTVFELETIDADVSAGEFTLCNSNLIPSHVRQGHDGALVVTEWDFAGSLTPEFELASALTHWALRPSVNHAAIGAFRAGYLDAAEWPKLELGSFTIAVTAWLNWAHNAICEAIDPDDEERAVFAEREAVGVLDRPMTRASLEQLLDD